MMRRKLIAGLALLLLTGGPMTGLAQSETALPEAAAEALERAENAMQEALRTYDSQYPDRPLWQQAFREARSAQELAPDRTEPLRFLAEAYSRANWYGPAWSAWNRLLEGGAELDAEATPLFVEVGQQLAFTFYQQDDTERAAEIYRRVLDVVPFDLESYTWLGRILLEQGRPEQAISYWKTVVDRNPSDRRAAYFLQLARDQAEYGTDAVNEFRAGVRFYEEGDLVRARERFARATSLNPEYAEAWAWLGRVEFDREDYGDARSFYRRALDEAPGNDTYRYFFEEAGRRADAAAAPTDPPAGDTARNAPTPPAPGAAGEGAPRGD